MIYGDNPQKTNEQEDKLGLKSYSYAPQISAIMQAGNLYLYCISNPVLNTDPSGDVILNGAAGVYGLMDLLYAFLAAIASVGSGLCYVILGVGLIVAVGSVIYLIVDQGNEGAKTVDDILDDAEPGRKTKGKSQQYEKDGDYEDALDDFEALGLENVTQKDDGTLVGETSDGKIVNVRDHSSSGYPTLEIYDPETGKSIKIRYK